MPHNFHAAPAAVDLSAAPRRHATHSPFSSSRHHSFPSRRLWPPLLELPPPTSALNDVPDPVFGCRLKVRVSPSPRA